AESTMELITGIISGIRNVRGEMNIPPSSLLDVFVQSQDTTTRKIIKNHQNIVVNLAGLKNLAVEQTGEKPKAVATAIVGNAAIFISLEGIIDFAKERKRLEKEIEKLSGELSALSKKLSNEDFLNKAPETVVEKVKEKHRVILEKQQKLGANLDKIKELGD
ncbi:MAG: valine--tRNA ligase, partial [Thermodesulfobacteriota bacterium]|nr:valine--tRNA ligase [Thermodesulfobacteriota bacterium]